ncbi:ATPase family AAA domain-containing protein 5 isoform X1 [Bufo gargarizans]|uniref:ATPase family AAA domain-containing protein 5 isoform X1 n=1 Tax=Bufo gargarizans TaxID=30331 RepID=UPI001CF53694|nr:ATPase family AAA domain-containing protein 5 isoform X1 [Bufo gargarizans]
MVGVLAVSAPLEDYTVQPCKKQRKDEDPLSKPITNYFSPVSRSGEKGLTSPKSSSIADYFIRSSPTPSDKTAIITKDTPSTPPTGSSKPASRIGKRTKLVKRLSDVAPPAGGRNIGIMGSDTAALLADICGRTADLAGDDVMFQSETSDGGGMSKPRRGQSLKRRNMGKGQVIGEPPNQQPLPIRSNVSSEVDSSLEVHADNTSDNPATLTISFEDFMKSQEEKDQSECSSVDSSGGDPKMAQLPSPKMVTVQAQVHLSPPLPGQKSTNIASIFKKQKVGSKKASTPPPECQQVGHLLPKRRSNVVIQEEDLELAVIDVEHREPTKQKSTPAERQQFMNAFRQAGEPSKPNAKKNPARKKDLKEATENQQELEEEEQVPDKVVTENKAEETDKPSKLKRRRKKKKPPPSPESSRPALPLHCSPVLRRSLRSQKSTPARKSPERPSAESPILMSTPKVRAPCQRSDDVYKSEVLTMPSDTESPIRMRFTRVTRRNNRRRPGSGSDEEAFPLGFNKVSESSKKISRAKQLLEKAKAIQQNLGKAETPQRRSTRQKSRGTQEPIAKKIMQKTANLRSLNDVLGKKAKTKSLPSAHKKEVKKKEVKGGVITIEDGSEASENSQDDEQFKAKREFLMSGLPDSLKRQIARTSAMMEAYSVSGSAFQRVLHVQQKDGCPMWSLAMPCCRLLTTFSPSCGSVLDILRLPLSLGDVTCVNSKSAVQTLPALVTRRRLFPEVIRDCLLEEIRWYNPQFPVRRFLKQFLTRQNDYLSLQEAHKPAAAKQIEKSLKLTDGDISSAVQETGSGAKRKRNDSLGKKSKRRKASMSTGDEDEAQTDRAPASKGQLPRSARRKSSGPPTEPDVVIIKEEDPTPVAEDAVGEDVLWTEKYQPQNSSELIGNSAAVGRLHSWLREWKMRAEKEEKKNRMQKTGKDKDDTWNTGDFHDSEDSDEDSLCNTLLITGPPGVGKTAAVYACAQELGFKVFEVNASCQRSGRQILAQLKEATQSHQVEQQGVNAHKPCFFNSSSSTRSPRKLNSPKRVVSSPRKPPVSPRGPGLKKELAPKSLANFFKAALKQKQEGKKTTSELVRAPQPGQDGKASRPHPFVTDKESGSEESQRKSATSLILFEEVDIIFDDDVGFLSAIKTFMSTTKRPVVLTSSDPLFGMMFDGAFEEISFHTPSVVNVASFLQVLCLAENLRTDPKDLRTFVAASRCDIRQSVLQLQFWARSGGGGLREKPLLPPDNQKLELSEASDVPGCSVGCAENLLGVNNIIAPTDSVISFLKEKIQEAAEWEKILLLLAEFHTRKVYFTSSNLAFLLPLPVDLGSPVAPPVCEYQERAPLPDDDCLPEDRSVKPPAAMKRRRKLVLLNDSDLFESDSNSLDEILAVGTKQPEEKAPPVSAVRVVKRTLSSAELQASLLVSQCLDSMAEFADHMSSLDCSTSDTADPAHICGPNWTESRLKHGLCDGLRTDSRDWWSAQSCAEIRALMEALAFQKCSAKLSKALDSHLELCKQSGRDPTEELTLHVPQAREQLYVGQPAATTGVAERRLSVVKDVLSHRAFISLGNRDINVTEYLPALRSICRLQKAKEEGKTKRRFLHYLEGIHLELPKATLSSLAVDFP